MILNTAKYLQEMRTNQWLPKEKLEQIQLTKLKKMVHHAYDSVPYYRTMFNNLKLSPDDIKSVEDLEKIPITTKKDLTANFPNKIMSSVANIDACSLEQTSGSSGFVLNVMRSPQTREYELALVMHALFECGMKMHDLMFVIEDPRSQHKDQKSVLNRFGMMRKFRMSVYEDPRIILKNLQEKQPDVIYGYPSVLFLISNIMKNENIELKKYPKFIVSVSENLRDKFREVVEETFRCPIYNHYGSTEFPRVSWQCKNKDPLHINADSHVVEFISEGKPVKNKRGLITITSLYNFGMPFLRYGINDVAQSIEDKHCDCKRGLPLMSSIEGRTDDFLVDSDNKVISPKILCYELDDINGIIEFSVLQEEKGHAEITMVKGPKYSEKEVTDTLERINKWTHGKIELKVIYTNSIVREKKKLRAVVSKVKPDF
jgi:phenylacetate-CoA ligase